MRESRVMKIEDCYGIMHGIWLPARIDGESDIFISIGHLIAVETDSGSFTGNLEDIARIPEDDIDYEEAVVLRTDYGDLRIPFSEIISIEVD